MAAMTEAVQTFQLEDQSELRLEIDFDTVVIVVLKDGLAEVLGLELAIGKEYAFAGCNVAVYSWFGAALEVRGAPKSAYRRPSGISRLRIAFSLKRTTPAGRCRKNHRKRSSSRRARPAQVRVLARRDDAGRRHQRALVPRDAARRGCEERVGGGRGRRVRAAER